jgi:hypothetical protein
MSRTRDPGLYCPQLDWLLRCSSAALGQRGTTAAVVSAIERGGAGGGGEDPNFSMLLRCYGLPAEEGKRVSDNVIAKERRLSRRFQQLTTEQQRVLVARYLLEQHADRLTHQRFGKVAGVVLYQWLQSRSEQRQQERLVATNEADEQAEPYHARLADLQNAILVSEVVMELRWGSRLQHTARVHYLRRLLSATWRELGLLRRRESTVLEFGGLEADTKALALACSRGAPPPLEEPADQACRAAHRAWYDTSAQEAQRWADGEDEAGSELAPAS